MGLLNDYRWAGSAEPTPRAEPLSQAPDVPYGDVITAAADRYGVPADALMRIASVESGFNPRAIGQPTQWGRARGLFQFLDSTARGLGIDPMDPAQAADGAARMFADNMARFGSVEGAVAAHFAGPDTSMWGPKTAQYVRDVLGRDLSAPARKERANPFADDLAAVDEIMRGLSAPPRPAEAPAADDTQSTGAGGDAWRLFKAGSAQTLGAIPRLADLLTGGAIGKDTADGLARYAEERLAETTPDTRAALAKKWLSDEPDKLFGDAWSDWRSYAAGVVQNLPSFLPGLGTTAWAVRSARAAAATDAALAAGRAMASGATRELADAAAGSAFKATFQREATRLAARAGMATEGVIGSGQNAEQARGEIMGLSAADLMALPEAQALAADGKDENAIREELARRAMKPAAVLGGLADAAFGGVGDRVLARLMTGEGGTLLRRFATGFAGEAGEEAAQSAGEQIGVNVGLQQTGMDRGTFAGVGEQALGGAIIGGLMGGGAGGLLGSREAPLVPDAQAGSPAADMPVGMTDAEIEAARASAQADAARTADIQAMRAGTAAAQANPLVPFVPQMSRFSERAGPGQTANMGNLGGLLSSPFGRTLEGEFTVEPGPLPSQGDALSQVMAHSAQRIDALESALRQAPVMDVPAPQAAVPQAPVQPAPGQGKAPPIPAEAVDYAVQALTANPALTPQQLSQELGVPGLVARRVLTAARKMMPPVRTNPVTTGEIATNNAATEVAPPAQPPLANPEPAVAGAQPAPEAAPTSPRSAAQAIPQHQQPAAKTPPGEAGTPPVLTNPAAKMPPNAVQGGKTGSSTTTPAPATAAPASETIEAGKARGLKVSKIDDIIAAYKGDKMFASMAADLEKKKAEGATLVVMRGPTAYPARDQAHAELIIKGILAARDEKNAAAKKADARLVGYVVGSYARQEGAPADIIASIINIAKNGNLRGLKRGGRMPDGEMAGGDDLKILYAAGITTAQQLEDAIVAERARMAAAEARRQAVPPGETAATPATAPTTETGSTGQRRAGLAVGGAEDLDASIDEIRARTSPPTTPAPAAPPERVSSNTIITDAMAEAARARLKSKLGRLNTGIDPEMLADGAVLAAYHIERGFRSFAAYSAQMIGDMGEAVRPYLRAFYEGARHFPGFDAEGMTSYADLERLKEGRGERQTVVTPQGREIETQFEVVPLADLIDSANADFPAELQPRDRAGRLASQAQIAEMAAKLDPEQLNDSRLASQGAPVVGADGVVESGNGRVAAIRSAYQKGGARADAYRAMIAARGFDVAGIESPVLIRRRLTDLSPRERIEFAHEANASATLGMSATERAQADARFLDDALLERYRGGEMTSAANSEFVRGFMAEVAPGDRAEMIAADGRLSQAGVRRIESAILARAYADADLLQSLTESTDSNIKTIGGALLDAAPSFAKLRAAIEAGAVPEALDITEHVVGAARLVSDARRQGIALSERVAQNDIMAGATPAMTEDVLRLMFRDEGFKRPAGRDAIADLLREYADSAMSVQAGDSLFAELPQVKAVDILSTLQEKANAETRQAESQQALFGANPFGTSRAGRRGEASRTGDGRQGRGDVARGARQAGVEAVEPENPDAAGSRADLERDRRDAEPGDAVGAQGVPAGAASDGGPAGRRVPEPEGQGRSAADRSGDVDGQTLDVGGAGHRWLSDGSEPAGPAGGAADRGDAGGSRATGGTGVQPDADTGAAAVAVATAGATKPADLAAKRAAQAAAQNVVVVPKDPDNIRDALPFLTDGQRDDVLFAEQRFEKPDGYGVLFTNGTGTGKTYTSLGVVKRFERAGRTNILIVVPSQTLIDDYVAAGKNLLLDVKPLDGTRDNGGSGPVITTYDAFGENDTLAQRAWDLIVTDESQFLGRGADGKSTHAIEALRALALHPDGSGKRAKMLHPGLYEAAVEANRALHKNINPAMQAELQAQADQAHAAWGAALKQVEADVKAKQGAARPRVVMLSATPFAYRENIQYADGFLLNFEADDTTGGYNAPKSGFNKFMVSHFGYRMRYGKLTKPEVGVNVGLMETELNARLRRSGALSWRGLAVDADYDRKFLIAHDAVGAKIDEGQDFLRASDNSARFSKLRAKLTDRFNYLAQSQLLEAIKAKAAIPYIRASLDAGRKVVVFHNYNVGGAVHPFRLPELETIAGEKDESELAKQYRAFKEERPDLYNLDLTGLVSPIDALTRAFPEALLFNGTVPPKVRTRNKALFNADDGKHRIIIVQADAGGAGLSLHDTTGTFQRVLLNIGLPIHPVAAIQQEGRIYRIGVMTDAIIRYMATGTIFERIAFAQKIAERSSTVENLAMGSAARDLKRAFIDAFQDARKETPSADDGKGGKAADRAIDRALTPFDKAKTHYFAQMKKAGRRDQREGFDYFPTPEPVGLKMVEWLRLKANDSALEPSAGHGAIARYFPEDVRATAVELSNDLASRLAMAMTGRVITGKFEDLHVTNKYDGIAMNPPFGKGGKLAVEHLAKAATHLNSGGRIVALLPRGPSADKRFDQWYESDEAKGFHLVADITMPAVLFERAGTGVSTRIVIIDRSNDPAQQRNRDLSSAETIGELFDRLQDMEMPPRSPAASKADARVKFADPDSAASSDFHEASAGAADAVRAMPTLARLGIKVTPTITANGKAAWEVSGKTFEHKDAIKRAGGKWYGPKKVWTFYDGDPTEELSQALDNQNGSTAEPEKPYETDLFGNPIPAKRGRAAGRAAPAGQRNMDAAAAIPPAAEHAPDNPDAGTYGTVAELVETRRQQLGHAGPVKTLEDSANALAYLHRSAVERVDALVTDADGKPLAIVGGFKGDIASSTVPKMTLVAEIMQVPGAKVAWISHNHPSDLETLSSGDLSLARDIHDALKGSGVTLGGLTSVTQSRWAGYDPEWDGTHTGDINPVDGAFIPAQERQLSARGKLGEKITGPASAAAQGRRLMESHGGRPGIMMLDSQNAPIAYVPWNPLRAERLKDNGGLAALYRAISRANPRSAIIMTDGAMSSEAAKNLATGLSQLDVRVLDIITPEGSFAEAGRSLHNQALYSRQPAAGSQPSPALHAAVVSGDAGRVLSELRNDLERAGDEFGVLVVDRLSTLDRGPLSFSYSGGEKRLNSYSPLYHLIRLYDGYSAHALLHELVHAFTAHAYKSANAKERARIDAVYEAARAAGADDYHYGLTSVDEFMAEVFSNRDFRDFLKSVPYQKTTLWGGFVQAVRRLLGFPAEQTSALDEAIDAIDSEIFARNTNGAVASRFHATPLRMAENATPAPEKAPPPYKSPTDTIAGVDTGKYGFDYADVLGDKSPDSRLRRLSEILYENREGTEIEGILSDPADKAASVGEIYDELAWLRDTAVDLGNLPQWGDANFSPEDFPGNVNSARAARLLMTDADVARLARNGGTAGSGTLYSRLSSTPASRGTNGQGLPLGQVQRLATTFARKLGVDPARVVVLRSADEIGAPAEYTTKGAYDSNTDTVYLFADALDDADDARRVLLHEVVGHLGVRAAVGDDWAKVRRLLEQGRARDRGIADLFERVAREESADLDADAVADEVIARAAERYGAAGPLHWRRILGAIRAALRRLGLVSDGYSLNEVVDLLAAGRRAVRAGAATGGDALAYARQTKAQGRIRRTIDELVSAAQSQAHWRDWYARHENVLSDLFGNDAALFQRMLSATSQANTVKGNVTLALKAYAQFLDGQPFTGYLPAVTKNLDRIRADEELQGAKISQYGKANEGDESAIAVDRHISILLFNSAKPNAAQIKAAKARIRTVADRLGWAPRELQAALWAFNQTRLGTNPDEVQSYDRLLEARADFIRELRAEYGRGEGGSLPARRGLGEGTEEGAAAEGSADALRFSRARDLSGNVADYVRDTISSPRTFNLLNRTVGTQLHKAWKSPEYARVYRSVQDFLQDAQTMAYRASDKAKSLLPKLDGVRDVFQHIYPRDAKGRRVRRADVSKAAAAVFDGRIADRRWSDDELRARGLNDTQIGLYHEARAAIDASLDDVAASVMARLAMLDSVPGALITQAQAEPGRAFAILSPHVKDATLSRMREENGRIAKLKRNGYAPLSRFGDYFVRVTKPGPRGGDEVLFRAHFESKREMFAAARALEADPEYRGAQVATGVLPKEDSTMFTGLTPETLELFGDALGLDMGKHSAAYQEYLKTAVAARSALKRLIHARKIEGYSQDLERVLASFIISNSRHASRAYHTTEMNRARADIPERMGDVRDEAGRLIDYVQNPREEAAGVRSLLFAQFLGGSVASALTNMTQPIMMTYPYLSSIKGVGPAKAAALMARAVKAITTGGDRDLMAAMKRAEADGTVAPQEIHQLYAEAIRSGLSSNRYVGRWLRAAAAVWGSLFSLSEQVNRRITFAAAYLAARETGRADPFAFAEQAVNETQGVYNKGNRPNVARGAPGAVLMTFKQYSIAYMEFLARLPTRERAMALGILMLAAGLQGLPGADDLDDGIDTLAQALGYNFRSEDAKRRFLQRMFGNGLADFLMYGLSTTGVPLDFQQRLGLGNLIPGTALLKRSSTDKSRDVMELAGPAGSVVQQWMRAWDAFTSTGLAEGALLRGGWEALQQLAPVAFGNALKASDMFNTGYALDAKGKRIAPVTTGDAVTKLIGFQPASLAAGQRNREGAQESIALAKDEESRITEIWADGLFQKDRELVARARERLDDWNTKNPEAPIRVTLQQIRRRVQEMGRTRDERLIRSAPRELRQGARETISG